MIYNIDNTNVEFQDDELVRVKKCNNCIVLTSSQHYSHVSKIQKIGNGKYIRSSDGSIHDLKENKNRLPNGTYYTRLKQIICGNCTPDNSVFTTLTYDNNNKEICDEIAKDYKKYIRTLRQELGADLGYILVTELQKRGVPHFHSILIFPYSIADDYNRIKIITEEVWTLGTAHTEKVFDVHGLSIYLSKDYRDKDMIFPKNKKKYRTSRNIAGIEPSITMSGAEANQLKSQMHSMSEEFICIKDEETGYYDEMKRYIGLLDAERSSK